MSSNGSKSFDEVNAIWAQKWPQIVAKAWENDDFRKSLIHDTRQVLEDEGLPLTPGMVYQISHGSGLATTSLPLPDKPDDWDGEDLGELGDSDGVFPDTSCCL